jgi:magnesium-protoporphyrin IX monomethyl ester (oxidative) cyclase
MTEVSKKKKFFDLFSNNNDKLKGVNVLLIYPPLRLSKKPVSPPLGLMSLAAVLEKAGAVVEILDLNMLRLNFSELKEELKKRKFDIVGMGGMATVYYYIKFLAKYLKSEYPNVPLIGGGTVCSGSPDVVIKSTSLDAIVIGEGEPIIISLVYALLNNEDLSAIEGIVYKDISGEIQKTNFRPRMMNLNDLPYPAYHLVEMEKYIENLHINKRKTNAVAETRIIELNIDRKKANRPIIIFTKRGCPYKCDFCYRNFGQTVVSNSVQYVLDHMKYLEEKYNTVSFLIEDETFNIDRDWILSFCKELIQEKRNYILAIGNGLRANLIDDELIINMKNAGFCSIGVGIESFYDLSLNDMVKLQTSEIIENAIKIINSHGLHFASAQFLFGYPSDNREAMRTNVKMCKKLGLKSAGFAIPCPYPGTALYQKALKQGLITDEEGWLLELSDKDISDRVINMSGKTDKFLKTQIAKGEDEIRMYFIRKQLPVIGHFLTLLQFIGRWFNLDFFSLIKGFKDGLISIFVHHKMPKSMLKSGGAKDTHIKEEIFELMNYNVRK